jgi:nucleotide-binding universal stress UspA family protein
MIEKILFPVDFSQSSVAISPYVKRTAAMFSSHVSLIHVCSLDSSNGFELYVRSPQEIAEEHWSNAKSKLDTFLQSEFPPVTSPRILTSGDAAAEIVKIARLNGFDLIVMPTHAGRFRQMLLGSTTAKVLNDAGCPVLTTEHADTVVPRPGNHRAWVCAIGLTADSERVLRLANRAAAQVGAKLSVIHTVHGHREQRSVLDPTGEKAARQSLDELQRKIGCDVPVRIAIGPVKEALLDAARESEADALVIGRTPGSGASGRMRDLTYSLIRDSPFPVLSV